MEVSENEVEALVAEADAYSLASHLFWAMWALLQSKVLSTTAVSSCERYMYCAVPYSGPPDLFLALRNSSTAYFDRRVRSPVMLRSLLLFLIGIRATLLRSASTTSSTPWKGSGPTGISPRASCRHRPRQRPSRSSLPLIGSGTIWRGDTG